MNYSQEKMINPLRDITKEAILAAPDNEEIFCTAKDLKDLVREVEEGFMLEKTLVAVPEGYGYVEVTSLGRIIAKPIKHLSRGYEYTAVIIDEVINDRA